MAFFGLLIYTAIIYIRPQEIYPAMGQFPIVQLVALATLYITFLTGRLSFNRMFSFAQNKLIFCFLAAVVLSHLSQFRIFGAWEVFVTFAQTVLLYMLILCLVDTPERLKVYIGLLVSLTFFLAFQGILQYHTGTSWGGQTALIRGDDEIRIRWIGVFSDPNDLALSLIVVIPFILFSFFSQGSFSKKLVAASLFLAIVYAIYLTKSRGGYLSLCGVLFLFFAIKHKGIKAALMAGLIIVSLLMLAPSRVTSNVSLGRSFVDYGRIDSWANGLWMFKSAPVFGVGVGRFEEFHVQAAHNSFVEIMAEAGLVGAFFWIALFYVTLRDFYRIGNLRPVAEEENPLDSSLMETATALVIGLMGFLCAAFFLSRAYFFIPYVFMAVWVVTVDLLFQDREELDFVFGMKDIRAVSLITVGGIFFLYIMIRFFWSVVQ